MMNLSSSCCGVNGDGSVGGSEKVTVVMGVLIGVRAGLVANMGVMLVGVGVGLNTEGERRENTERRRCVLSIKESVFLLIRKGKHFPADECICFVDRKAEENNFL